MRVIAVVFGAPTPKERNKQITQMFDLLLVNMKQSLFIRKMNMSGKCVQKGEQRKIQGVSWRKYFPFGEKGRK